MFNQSNFNDRNKSLKNDSDDERPSLPKHGSSLNGSAHIRYLERAGKFKVGSERLAILSETYLEKVSKWKVAVL